MEGCIKAAMQGEIREIADPELWDSFVEASPQGTIFSTSKWLNLYDREWEYLGYYKGNTLVGGLCHTEGASGYGIPLVAFQGVLCRSLTCARYTTRMSEQLEVAGAFADYLQPRYNKIVITNHYTLQDIRPFLWHGYKPEVKYTYVVNPEWLPESMEKDGRNLVRNSKWVVRPSSRLDVFDKLYEATFTRKGLSRPVSTMFIRKMWDTIPCELWLADDDSAGALMIRDSKRWYYILGASDGSGASTVTVYNAMLGKYEVDMVGCNNKEIASFKRSFGGELRPYYAVII